MIWIPGTKQPPTSLLTDAKKTGFSPIDISPAPIVWAEWLSLPSVHLWQAVALSCGIQPTTYQAASSADGMANQRDFMNRMQVAQDHLIPGGQIRTIIANKRKYLTRVLIADVANLASLCAWPVPDGFPLTEETGVKIRKRKDAILEEIIRRGINPQALPKIRSGIRTVKAEIKD